jgi:hypothetical protein
MAAPTGTGYPGLHWVIPHVPAGVAIVGSMREPGRRGWQQVLLMLSLILGVVAMHSTIACHADPGNAQGMAAHTGSAGAVSQPTGFSLSTQTPMAGLVGALALTADEPADSRVVPSQEMSTVALTAAVMRAAMAGPAGSNGHAALHDLLHLCLAVLTALALLAVAALLALFVGGRPAGGDSFAVLGRPVVGPRAPPPTSVRLAQLCVLRN